MTPIKIIGERIYLRTLTNDDASEKYCSWLNDPVVNRYLETMTATVPDLIKYIQEKNSSENCIFLGIFDSEKNQDNITQHIGNIKLEPIDFQNKIATISIMVGDKNYWKRGIAEKL